MPHRNHLPPEGFVRLKDIIGPTGLIPISRSGWYAGIKAGRFPKPTKKFLDPEPPLGAWMRSVSSSKIEPSE